MVFDVYHEITGEIIYVLEYALKFTVSLVKWTWVAVLTSVIINCLNIFMLIFLEKVNYKMQLSICADQDT